MLEAHADIDVAAAELLVDAVIAAAAAPPQEAEGAADVPLGPGVLDIAARRLAVERVAAGRRLLDGGAEVVDALVVGIDAVRADETVAVTVRVCAGARRVFAIVHAAELVAELVRHDVRAGDRRVLHDGERETFVHQLAG